MNHKGFPVFLCSCQNFPLLVLSRENAGGLKIQVHAQWNAKGLRPSDGKGKRVSGFCPRCNSPFDVRFPHLEERMDSELEDEFVLLLYSVWSNRKFDGFEIHGPCIQWVKDVTIKIPIPHPIRKVSILYASTLMRRSFALCLFLYQGMPFSHFPDWNNAGTDDEFDLWGRTFFDWVMGVCGFYFDTFKVSDMSRTQMVLASCIMAQRLQRSARYVENTNGTSIVYNGPENSDTKRGRKMQHRQPRKPLRNL